MWDPGRYFLLAAWERTGAHGAHPADRRGVSRHVDEHRQRDAYCGHAVMRDKQQRAYMYEVMRASDTENGQCACTCTAGAAHGPGMRRVALSVSREREPSTPAPSAPCHHSPRAMATLLSQRCGAHPPSCTPASSGCVLMAITAASMAPAAAARCFRLLAALSVPAMGVMRGVCGL